MMTESRLYLKSSSFKMALLFTALLSAVVLALGYLIYDFGREGLERESESALNLEINNIVLIRRLDPGREIADIIRERIDSNRGIHYLYTDVAGNYLAGDIKSVPVDVDRLIEGVIVFEIEGVESASDGRRKVVAKIHTFADGQQLLVARDMDEFFSRFARLRLFSVLSIACMLLVILVSFLISLFVVSRINRMSDTALAIMRTGDLSRRLTVDSSWDDLSHLSRVLNEMLSRIEGLVEGVKQVSNDIAHDLRTPLTRLRNRLEQMQRGETHSDDIDAAIAEADQLLETFNALLRISRMEVGQERSAFRELNLGGLLKDVSELYEPVMKDAGKSLILDLNVESDRMMGDRNLLFQACANLLDNAIKHSGSGGQVTLALHPGETDTVRIIFEDTGPGLRDDEKQKVFDRFYRCDHSRNKPGSGLGLSMVAAVVKLHRGKISLYDAPIGGLGVAVELPISLPNITHS